VGGRLAAGRLIIIFTGWRDRRQDALGGSGRRRCPGGACNRWVVSSIENEELPNQRGIPALAVKTALCDALPGCSHLYGPSREDGGLGQGHLGHAGIVPHAVPNNETGHLSAGVADGRSDHAPRPVALPNLRCLCRRWAKDTVNVGMLGVDYLSPVGAQIGGPQGVGALWHGLGAPLEAILYGGGQLSAHCGRVQKTSARIAGFGAAVEGWPSGFAEICRLAKGIADAMEAGLGRRMAGL